MSERAEETPQPPTVEIPPELKAELDDVILETERRVGGDTMGYAFDRLDKWRQMAKALVQAAAVPQKNPSEVVTVLMMAHDMELPQMVALRGMYVVNKKVAMEAWLMDLVATRLGVTKEITNETPVACYIVLHRDGCPDIESSFSLEEAKAAGLIYDYDETGVTKARNPVWKSYTRDMLYWRALSRGLRRIAPDMFGGVYLRDEVVGIDPRKQPSGEATELNADLGLEADEEADDE